MIQSRFLIVFILFFSWLTVNAQLTHIKYKVRVNNVNCNIGDEDGAYNDSDFEWEFDGTDDNSFSGNGCKRIGGENNPNSDINQVFMDQTTATTASSVTARWRAREDDDNDDCSNGEESGDDCKMSIYRTTTIDIRSGTACIWNSNGQDVSGTFCDGTYKLTFAHYWEPVANSVSSISRTGIGFICSGTSVTLTANFTDESTSGVTAETRWYTSSCGTTGHFATGNSVTVSPNSTTTYYARRVITSTCGSGNYGACSSITIDVASPPTSVSAQASSTEVCINGTYNLDWLSNTGGSLQGGSWEYEWRTSSGAVVRSWSATADYNGLSQSVAGAYSYILYVRRAGCTQETASSTITVNVRSAASGTPTLSSPADNEVIFTSTPTLTWTGGNLGNHSSSKFQIEIDGIVNDGTTANFYTTAALSAGAHTWRVLPYSDCGSGNWSSVRTFYYFPTVPACNTTIDHLNTDWVITSDITLGGTHNNINNFTINSGVTVTIPQGCPLVINAKNITINGIIDGNGKGTAGGAGGAKGGSAYAENDPWDCNKNSYSKGGSGGGSASGNGAASGGGNGVNGTDNCAACAYNNVAGGGGGGAGQGGGYGGKGGTSGDESWTATTGGAGGGTRVGIGTCGDKEGCSAIGTQACPGSGSSQADNTFDIAANDVGMGGGGGGAGGGGGSNVAGADGNKGGNGGGAVKLYFTGDFTMGATGRINVNGETGGSGGNGARGESIAYGLGSVWGGGGGGGGAGGGSGGGVLIYANNCAATINIASGAQINANGGDGGNGGAGGNNDNEANADAKAGVTGKGGGGGGGGRIKIYKSECGTYTNSATMSVSAGNRGGTGSPGDAEAGATSVSDLYTLATAKTITSDVPFVCYNTAAILSGSTPTVSPSGACTYSFQWYKCTVAGSFNETFTDNSATLPSGNWTTIGSDVEDLESVTLTQTTTFIRKTVLANNCIQWSNKVTVYAAGEATPNTSGVLATATCSTTCVVNDNLWHYFRNSSGQIIAAINANNNTGDPSKGLGSVMMTVKIETVPHDVSYLSPSHGNGGLGRNGDCSGQPELSMRRWYTITPTNQPAAGTPSTIRLFFTPSDYANYSNEINTWRPAFAPAYTLCYGTTANAEDLAVSKNESADIPIASTSLNGGPNNSTQYELSIPSFSTFRFHTNGGIGAPLPVELISFTGYHESVRNTLIWKTASESNTDRFDIEKSIDGSNWQYIGMQKAAGTTTSLTDYSFYDNVPVMGNNYYRLKIVDNDASYEYSNIINIKVGETEVNGIASVYPNPTDNEVTVVIQTTNAQNTVVSISNVLGQEVMSVPVSLVSGVNKVQLQTSGLPAGTYVIAYTDQNAKRYTEKLIKK